MRESDAERGTPPRAGNGDEQGQAQRGNIAPQAQQWQQQGYTPSPPLAGSPVNQIAGNNAAQNNLSAASFVDRNTLPEWLRAEAEQRQPSPPSNIPQPTPRSGPYVVPPRGGENVRVPNRPRGEMGPPESSEVAANVFASMLGVASNAPPFPSQVQGMPGGQRPPQQGMQPGMPPMQYGPQGQMHGAFPPGAGQPMPQGSPPGAYNPGYAGNFQPNAPMGMSSAMQRPQGQPNGMGMPSTGPGMAGEQRGNAKPVKRNLFEAIRNWLFRS
jgi:hypothetical protein